jgi:hypothetical protein
MGRSQAQGMLGSARKSAGAWDFVHDPSITLDHGMEFTLRALSRYSAYLHRQHGDRTAVDALYRKSDRFMLFSRA